jgi:hypothetical protein
MSGLQLPRTSSGMETYGVFWSKPHVMAIGFYTVEGRGDSRLQRRLVSLPCLFESRGELRVLFESSVHLCLDQCIFQSPELSARDLQGS